MSDYLLVQADSRRLPLADESVSMCITSPPYYSLRDYGTGRWVGGSADCDHRSPTMRAGRNEDRPMLAGSVATNAAQLLLAARSACGKCGARRVDRQIGLEADPGSYVAEMVRVFRDVKRCLHPTGVAFVNMGDAYASFGIMGSSAGLDEYARRERGQKDNGPKCGARKTGRAPTPPGCKPKDLLGIPWALAFALRDDGWWLRDPIVWAKAEVDDDDNLEGSAMPGSQQDRCTSAYEMMFMISKRPTYYYDREACKTSSGAMLRNVWRINPESYKGAHYATFPRELVRRAVLLGSSQAGVCPECGAPWRRTMERGEQVEAGHPRGQNAAYCAGRAVNGTSIKKWTRNSVGWQPTCKHNHDPIPALICDPFCGSATAGVVALALGRRFVGLDLSRDYLARDARRRIDRPHQVGWKRKDDHPLLAGLEE